MSWPHTKTENSPQDALRQIQNTECRIKKSFFFILNSKFSILFDLPLPPYLQKSNIRRVAARRDASLTRLASQRVAR